MRALCLPDRPRDKYPVCEDTHCSHTLRGGGWVVDAVVVVAVLCLRNVVEMCARKRVVELAEVVLSALELRLEWSCQSREAAQRFEDRGDKLAAICDLLEHCRDGLGV